MKKVSYSCIPAAFSLLFQNMDVGCQAYLQMGRNVKVLFIPSFWLESTMEECKFVQLVFMKAAKQDPARDAKIYINLVRQLFSDKEQLKQPQKETELHLFQIAVVSVGRLDGSDAKIISKPVKNMMRFIEQNGHPTDVHWEGVPSIYRHTQPKADQLIASTFSVWVVGADGNGRRKINPTGHQMVSLPEPFLIQVGVADAGFGEKMLPSGKKLGAFLLDP